MSGSTILPKDVADIATELSEAESNVIAVRQRAYDIVSAHMARGVPARQLSNINGGPFSYQTMLKIAQRLYEKPAEDRKHIADLEPSLF